MQHPILDNPSTLPAPPVAANQHLDHDTCPKSDTLLQLEQLTAQCELLQMLLDWMKNPTDHPELH